MIITNACTVQRLRYASILGVGLMSLMHGAFGVGIDDSDTQCSRLVWTRVGRMTSCVGFEVVSHVIWHLAAVDAGRVNTLDPP